MVDQLQQAADARLSSRTARRKAQAGITTALVNGLDAIRDLDVIVAIATRQQHPTTVAAWTAARRIEGQRDGSTRAPVPMPAPAPDPVVPVPPTPTPAPEPEPAMTSPVPLEKAS